MPLVKKDDRELKRYKVKFRTDPGLGELQPEAKQLDGKEYNFYKGFDSPDGQMMIPDDESYPADAPQSIPLADMEPIN